MAIIRAPRPSDRFAQISNEALADERLSYRARGVLAYLLSRPNGWRTTSAEIARQGVEGRDAVRVALQELETFGYMARRKHRDPDSGRWKHDQFVTDHPEGSPEHE